MKRSAIVSGVAAAILLTGCSQSKDGLPVSSPDLLSKPSTTVTAVIRTTNVPDGTCQEDMPCWDCSTMGNLICGPGVLYKHPTSNAHLLHNCGVVFEDDNEAFKTCSAAVLDS